MDVTRALKDLVSTALGFGAAVGLVDFNDSQIGVILGVVSAVGSLVVTFWGKGNDKPAS